MLLDTAHYHPWQGRLGSPWRACLAMVQVSLLQVFRRKAYWLVFGLGFLQFALFWSLIYILTQLSPPQRFRETIERRIGFSADESAGNENAYVGFMDRQSVVVMLLLAFSGSLLVGGDFHGQALPFYLSRRIGRVHYIAGKLLSVATITALVTVVPALVLFLEYGMFTSSTDYWTKNWRVPVSIVAYGGVMCLVLGVLLVSLSAWLQRAAPIAIAWSTLFLLLGRLAAYLREATENARWTLLDPWRDIRLVGRLCFGNFVRPGDRELAMEALALLAVVCTVALAYLVWRVRGVEIIE